jgi:CHRD domain
MRIKRLSLPVAAIMGVGLAVTASSDGNGGRNLRADLKGFREVPSVSTVAKGSFRARISQDGTAIEYRLNYEGLEGTVTQSHIHVGQMSVNGGISVWLCQSATNVAPVATTPTCANPPSEDEAEAAGTLTAADVIGPTGQGIAATEFAELVRAIRAGSAYANVHSSKFPAGEVRGQIQVDDGHDHHDH